MSTVSLVLNRHPRISDATRDLVLTTIRTLGYHPNHLARGLASKSSRTLSLMTPRNNPPFSDTYLSELVNGIFEVTAELSYKVILELADANCIRNGDYLSTLKSKQADGILFMGSKVSDRHLLNFENEPYPFVLLNHYFPGSGINHVSADYRTAGQLSAQHLLELGHRHVGILADSRLQATLDSVETFKAVYQSAGFYPEHLSVTDENSYEGHGFDAIRTLLTEHPQITALVCGNREIASHALQAATRLGKTIPTELSILGMGYFPPELCTLPRLTTTHTPLGEMGRMAARAAIDIFEGTTASIRMFLPTRLDIRDSTAPAPGSRCLS